MGKRGPDRSRPGGRPVVFATRVTEAEAARIDTIRRSLSRAQWMRWLIVKELRDYK